ncbi:MAG: prolyl oligopeptidase family serine peptidase [Flavobacteriales bacterium]|nr:prolyl oligopeptidase family serine peptidase [Flavobacteriales bacterium]
MTLAQLNKALPVELKRFPSVLWLNSRSFYFTNGATIYEVDAKKKQAKTILAYSESASNTDYHSGAQTLAYTIGNDLYIQDENGERRITENADGIVSGQAIARYEFGIVKGTFWSPDGSMLAFYEKDESKVGQYPITNYDTRPASTSMVRYPMAGTHGELASVGVVNRTSGKVTYLQLENNRKTDEFYATNLGWSPDGQTIYLAIVNRAQDHMWLKTYDARTGKELNVLFDETNERYVEPERAPHFVPGNSDKFLWFSERNGVDNLYLYSTSGKLLGQTNFNLPAKKILGFDEGAAFCFVECIAVNPTERHVMKVNLSDLSHERITDASGAHYAQLSPSGKYLLDTWSSIDVPRSVDLISASGRNVRNLLTALNPLEGYSCGKPEIMEIDPGNGYTYWGRMIKPSDFDPSKQYPVLVYVYSGPHAQLVENRWLGRASMWMYSMAEDGYIVFTVEGHGSSARGFEWESAVHRQMGTIEVDDQEACANWLKKQPFTDPDRFGIHGWSYGGFMTTSLMTKKPGLFKAGVAGGPVIDWNLYEVMYTERYMDTPQENPDGYEEAKLTNHISKLEDDLLIIHGADDDTVVMQHVMNLLTQAVADDIYLDFYVYPGHAHNVRGKDRVHLMTKILDYFKERL